MCRRTLGGVDADLVLDALADLLVERVAAKLAERRAEPERLLDVAEAARRLGIARSTLYSLIAAGRIATVKLGRRRLVPEGAIDQLLREGAG